MLDMGTQMLDMGHGLNVCICQGHRLLDTAVANRYSGPDWLVFFLLERMFPVDVQY